MTILYKSILLLVCLRLLLPGVALTEVLKLPALVGHFLHHRQVEGHAHFSDFLAEHYLDHDHHDQGDAEHNDHHHLPFSDHSDGVKEPIQPFLTIPELELIAFAPVPSVSDGVPLWHVSPCYPQFSPSIWQPPKLG